jgi:hypothetical protein
VKPLFSGFLLAAALVLAGCDSVDSVRDHLEPAASPHVLVFAADEPTTFAAAKAALAQMDYKFTHGGPAEGRMEALSPINSGAGSADQFSLAADFRPVDGGTEVSVVMKEMIEDDSANHLGQGTETPLRDTPLYAVFFHNIQSQIDLKK